MAQRIAKYEQGQAWLSAPTSDMRHSATAPQRHSATAPQRHSATAPQRHSATAKVTCRPSQRAILFGYLLPEHRSKPMVMLRVGLIALILVCTHGPYFRANMEPVPPRSTWACARSTAGMDVNPYNPNWSAVASTEQHCEQDTSKIAADKRRGTSLPPIPDVAVQEHAITLEECAAQLRKLQERVDFLEGYVFELLPPPTQERLDRRQQRPFTAEDVNILLEGFQRSMPTITPDGK